jgi:hypothetical protein
MSVSTLVRKNVVLDAALVEEVDRIVKSKGGRNKGYSFSGELTAALKEYVRRHTTQKEEAVSAPVWARLLQERAEQQDAWLRPGVWGAATYSATTALLLLELMCGKTLDPEDARDHFELIRGRAWKLVRREPAGKDGDAG